MLPNTKTKYKKEGRNEAIVEKSRKNPDGSERFAEYYGQLIDKVRHLESTGAPPQAGRYLSPTELDAIEAQMDGKPALHPSLAQCVAMVMEIRTACGRPSPL